MAEEKVIINIEVSNEQATAAINKAANELGKLRQEQTDLNKAYNEGSLSRKEYVKEMKDIRKQMSENNAIIKANEKVLRDNAKAAKEAEGSLNQMRSELKAMLKQYDSLSKAERENAEVGGRLLQQIQQQTAAVNEAEQATGRFQRNVGNYPKVFDLANTSMGKFAAMFNSLSQGTGKLSVAMGGAKQAVAAFGKQLLALLANPIVAVIAAIVVVVMKLVDAFKRSDDAMTSLQSAFAAFQPIVTAVRVVLEKMAETLGKIIEGSANAVTAILRLIPAYKQAQDEAQGLVKSQDELEEKEREYVVESAKNNKEIAELRTKAADRDKYTAKEREAFLNKAISLEEKNMKMERDNAKQSYEIEKQRQSQLRKRTDEDKDKLAELEAAMYKAEENYYSGIIRMQKQAQSAREEDARAEEQALKEREQKYKEYLERRKQQQALELQYRRSYQDIVLEVVKEGEEKEKAQTRLNYQRKKEDLQKALNEEKNLTKAAREEINKAIMLLEAQMQIELNKIIKKYADQRDHDAAAAEAEMVAEIAAGQAAVDKNIRDEFKKQSENYILTLKQQLAQAGGNLQMVADAELEFAKKKYDQLVNMDAEAYEAMGMNTTTYKIAVLEAAEDVNNALMNQKRVAAEVADGYLSAASTISSAMTDLFNTIGEDNEKMTDYLRGLAMINIAIQTSEALSKAIAAGAGKEWPENLAAIASGIAAVLGGVAQATAIMNKAADTPSAPRFAEGGLVEGSGTGTSDSITARVSNGEAVMNAKSVAATAPLLSAINQMYGGAPIGDNRTGSNDALREIIREAVADIQPVVSVKEITQVSNRVKVKEQIARQ